MRKELNLDNQGQHLNISIFNDKLEKILSNKDFLNYTKTILYAKINLIDKPERDALTKPKRQVGKNKNNSSMESQQFVKVKKIYGKSSNHYNLDMLNSTTLSFPKLKHYSTSKEKDIKFLSKTKELYRSNSTLSNFVNSSNMKGSSIVNFNVENFENNKDTIDNSILRRTMSYDFFKS